MHTKSFENGGDVEHEGVPRFLGPGPWHASREHGSAEARALESKREKNR